MSTLVVGLGTGRCGTQSLAALLDAQPDAEVTHERFGHRVRWGAPYRTYPQALALQCDAAAAALVGDVASYWLPQVEAMHRKAGARFVCLQRPREEVVQSFMRKVGDGVDHWRYLPEQSTVWSWCFPCFDAESRADAIALYWDAYYDEVQRLKKGGVPIYMMQTSDLSDRDARAECLSWLGVDSPNIDIAPHKNRTRA